MTRLESHYRREDGAYLIEMKLRDPRQLFNSLDPAPFHEKDLDDEAAEYLLGAVHDFRLPAPLKLVIYLPQGTEQATLETVVAAIRHYFDYRALVSRRELKRIFHEGRQALAVGLVFLSACMLGQHLVAAVVQAPWSGFLEEGLLIIGWVAMWRPLELLLYQWWPVRRRRATHEKIRHMPVEMRLLDGHDQVVERMLFTEPGSVPHE